MNLNIYFAFTDKLLILALGIGIGASRVVKAVISSFDSISIYLDPVSLRLAS